MMFWSTTTIKKSLGKEKRFSGCAPLSWTDDECFREEDINREDGPDCSDPDHCCAETSVSGIFCPLNIFRVYLPVFYTFFSHETDCNIIFCSVYTSYGGAPI